MDTVTLFRNLVTGEFIPDFSYAFQKFSFRTVFYVSQYHHCCCPCSFEHEYLDYISESGRIDEDKYEKVETNIVNGKCPHVDNVPRKYVAETAIYGIHIATALGTNRIMVPNRRKSGRFERRSSGREHGQTQRGKIFQLDPFETALMKRRVCIDDLVRKSHVTAGSPCSLGGLDALYASNRIIAAARDLENINVLHIQPKTCFEVFIQGNNIRSLKEAVLQKGEHTIVTCKILQYSMKHKISDLQDYILKYNRKTQVLSGNIRSLAISAVVYDCPGIFAVLLETTKPRDIAGDLKSKLTMACHLLARKNCMAVLMQYYCCDVTQKITEKIIYSQFKEMLSLLFEFYDDVKCEVWSAFDRITSISDGRCLRPLKKNGLFRSYLNFEVQNGPNVSTWEGIEEICAASDNWNQTLSHIYCLLKAWKKRDRFREQRRHFRETLEYLIYANSTSLLDTSIVLLAIKCDQHDFESCTKGVVREGRYTMDANGHSVFGHEDENVALNFTGPLLIESGFPFTKKAMNYSEDIALHSVELPYLRKCAEMPRSLKVSCRDTLRKYYTGRRIHKFVAICNIPQSVRDFILLRPLLQVLPT